MSTEGDPPEPPKDPPPPATEPLVLPASIDDVSKPAAASKPATASKPAPVAPSKPSTVTASDPAPTAAMAASDDASKPATGSPNKSASEASSNPAEPASFLEAAPATDESILPMTYDENSLADAVGVRRRDRTSKSVISESLDEEGLPDEAKWSRKTIAVIALAIIVGLGVTALVLLGRVNSQRYVLACTTSRAVAEQGRAFPPWGSAPLPGAEWKPIALPPNAQCKRRELEDKSQLEGVFLDALLERSSATLTTRDFLDAPGTSVNGKPEVSPLELVSMQLEQALLLSRSPERGDQRKQVERLQGDVQYWRAALRLRDATAAMAEASRQFDQAALARPMHVSDAGAWAEFLRRLNDELKAGPGGVPAGFPPAPTSERPGAPVGTALPVEPPPATGSDDAPPPPIDAGVPTGGVLL